MATGEKSDSFRVGDFVGLPVTEGTYEIVDLRDDGGVYTATLRPTQLTLMPVSYLRPER